MLATFLVDEALARAESAWVADAPLSKNMAATLPAKDLGFFRAIHGAPHGGELLELHAKRTATHVNRLNTAFIALLARRGREIAKAGADLTAFGNANGFAEFLAAAGSGLKHEAQTEKAFLLAVERLARVTARAAGRH